MSETSRRPAAALPISIAMATYNGAAYLAEQLASLAAQRLLPAELVVTDDGSSDDTLAILEHFAADSPFPVHIHRNPQRLGYRANFMHAAALCTGTLISFCDQDDIWLPDNLADVAVCFADPDVLLVFHNALLVDAQRKPISPFYADPPIPDHAARLSLPPWSFSYGFTQTFRASLLVTKDHWPAMIDHHHHDEPMGHDLFFFLIASALGPVAYLDKILTEYRLHGGNTIGSGKRTRPSLIDRWRYRLEDRSATYRYLSRVATCNAALFDRLSDGVLPDPAWRRHAAEAASAWHALTPLYADRALVCSATLPRRCAAFIRLLRADAYSEKGFWTFGGKAMKKDLMLGVILAPLIRRFGRETSGSDRACRRGKLSAIPITSF